MFCNKCGASCADGAKFCNSCGNPLQAAPQAPQQPVYQQPAQSTDFVGTLKKNWTMIIAIVAAFALLMGILTTFCILEVPVTAKGGGETETEYGTVEETSDALKLLDGSFAMGIVGNILFGVICLAVGATGILYFLKAKKGMPYYDQFIAKYIKTDNPAFIMGAAGVVGAVVQFVLFLLCGVEKSLFGYKISVSVGVPWLTWVALVVFAALAAVDKFVLNKKQ